MQRAGLKKHLEILISKSETNPNFQKFKTELRLAGTESHCKLCGTLVASVLPFHASNYLNLFRASDFGFEISGSVSLGSCPSSGCVLTAASGLSALSSSFG